MKTKIFTSILTVLTLTAASQLSAATFVVNDLSDSGAGTLRQAVLDANANVGDDDITFSVTGTITLATNLPAITDNLVVSGPGTNLLTISGNSKFRVFIMTGGHSNSVSDLTITDAYAGGTPVPGGPGVLFAKAPGIANDGKLTVRRCVVQNCHIDYAYGGGVYNSGTLDIETCVIVDSGATPQGDPMSQGGGIYQTNGMLRMKDCTILRCRAGNTRNGGGIASYGTASVVDLTNTRIEECNKNTVQSDGGGIAFQGTVIMNDSAVVKCSGYWGGGIVGGGMLLMTNSTVAGNGASDYGAGLSIGGISVLSGCTISSNYSTFGAAGVRNSGDLKMYNCTISANRTGTTVIDRTAGAISDSPLAKTYLNHCTVVSNTSPREINALGNFTSQGSIIGNITGTLNSEGYNLIISTYGTTVTNDVTGNIYDVNPVLGPLQNNGGSTLTHALLPGSSAINNATTGGLVTDQRGVSRNGGADIGSFEATTFEQPVLNIARSGANQITLSWAATPVVYMVQQNSDLTGGSWLDINAFTFVNGASMEVILPITDGNTLTLYRLRSL